MFNFSEEVKASYKLADEAGKTDPAFAEELKLM